MAGHLHEEQRPLGVEADPERAGDLKAIGRGSITRGGSRATRTGGSPSRPWAMPTVAGQGAVAVTGTIMEFMACCFSGTVAAATIHPLQPRPGLCANATLSPPGPCRNDRDRSNIDQTGLSGISTGDERRHDPRAHGREAPTGQNDAGNSAGRASGAELARVRDSMVRRECEAIGFRLDLLEQRSSRRAPIFRGPVPSRSPCVCGPARASRARPS